MAPPSQELEPPAIPGRFTITARGQLGTTATEHDAGSRAQLVLRYVGEDPAGIIYDLLVNYAGIDAGYIDLDSWLNQTESFLQQNYSANIAEPTDVNKLVSELIEQAALAVWWDPLEQLIRLQVLRAISTEAAVFDEDNTMEGSLTIQEQPTTRLSQVFVYFGQRDPLAPIDEERNFRSSVLTVDGDAEAAYNNLPMIKKVYSRWIPFGARSVAIRISNILLGRFRDPPRRFGLNLFRHGNENPQLGGGYRLKSWTIQDVTGAPTNAPIQITKLNPLSDRYEVQAEEMLFVDPDPADLVNRIIIIDSAINNVNLRDLHDAIYPDPDAGASPAENLTVIIENNVMIGSVSTSQRAFTVGNWPVSYPITIVLRGRIQGAGGNGGHPEGNGLSGGPAFYTRFPITLDLSAGSTAEIWGGGGGGGGHNDDDYGAGGGSGNIPGLGAFGSNGTGANGTTESGGAGAGSAGAGGNPGQSGQSSSQRSGGAAGRAIDGVSFVTKIGTGDIRGPQVN